MKHSFRFGPATVCTLVVLFCSAIFCGWKLKSLTPGSSEEWVTRPNSLSSQEPPQTESTAAAQPGPAAPSPARPLEARASKLISQDKLWSLQPSEPAFAAFAQWVDRYAQTTDPAEKAALESEGIRLAQLRRSAMFSMIQTDPERALELAAPLAVRNQLPGAVNDLLEERISGRGDLEVFGVRPLPGQESEVVPIYRTASLNGRNYRTFVYGVREDDPTRGDLPMNGVAVDDVLALSENPVRLLEPEEIQALNETGLGDVVCSVSEEPVTTNQESTPVDVGGEVRWLCRYNHAEILNEQLQLAASGNATLGATEGSLAESPYTEGRKRIVLFRVAFSNLTTPALSVSDGEALLANINDYWTRVSYGRTTSALAGQGSDVVLVTLTNATTLYDGDAGALRGDVRAAAEASGVDLSRYDFDITCVGSNPKYSFAGLGYVGAPGAWLANGYFGTATAVHELGHNLNFPHANFWDTGGQSAIGPGGNQEYGDPFDVMGGGGSGAGDYVVKFKWRAGWIPDEDYPRISSSGLYRIYAQDHPDSLGLRGLRFRQNTSQDYSLEFRQRYTGNPWMMNGIGLRWGSSSGSSSQLIDTTPGTSDGKNDSPIVIGRTFTDSDAAVHITPVGLGHTYPESIDVVVNFGTFPGNRAPSAVVSTGAASASPGSPITLQVVAADPDGDELAYHWDFGDGSFGPNAVTADHSWNSAGDYVVRCTVSDMKGGATSDSIIVRIGSSTTYSISGRIFDNGQPVPDVLVKATSSRYAYTDSDGSYTITRLSAGSYTVTAQRHPMTFANPWFSNPVSVGPNAANIDFITVELVDNTLIPENATWKYLDNGTDPGTSWRMAGFNDSTWASGPAQLGYGDGDEATVISYGPNANNKYIASYFRHTFTVNNKAGQTNFTLRFLRDDGGVVYLNGQEILRDNMPAGTITSTTRATDNSEDTTLIKVPASALQEGENLLAAEVHQVLPNSSDVSFQIGMTATFIPDLTGLTLFYIASPSNNDLLADPATIDITVNTFPSASAFTKMEFFVDAEKIGERTAAPFSLPWNSPTRGVHVLTVRGTDVDGNVSTTAPIRITIGDEIPLPPDPVALIPAGSTWKYLDDGSNQGTAWRAPGFNDTAWSSGPAQLGYGDGDEATVINCCASGSSAKYITTYFRHHFNVDNPDLISALSVRLLRDDGGVVYLNGTEIFRSNMPGGTISYTTTASGATPNADENVFFETSASSSLLVAGPNVMAVEIHQNGTTSSDVSFDLALEAQIMAPPPRGVTLSGVTDGARYDAPAALTLSAQAVPAPGTTIERVEFYDGATLLSTDMESPYELPWPEVPLGSHSVTAHAFEAGGGELISDPLSFEVSLPPSGYQLISSGTRWKYLDTGTTPAANWMTSAFDDTMWSSGSSRLGYGGDGELTVLSYGTDAAHKHITTWFRKSFDVSNPSAWDALKLRLQRDDGAVVYLNGVEVFRDNLLPGLVSPNSLALQAVEGADETTFLETTVSASRLVAGPNLVAVEIHQQAIDSSDLGFDLELIGLTEMNLTEGVYLTQPANTARFNSPATIGLAAYAAAADGVSKVEFYADETKVGEALSAPYQAIWNNATDGAYQITARATHGAGSIMVSPAVEITVGQPAPPITAVTYPNITLGSAWRYNDNGQDLGSTWRQSDFDDSAWPQGPARLGFGFDGEATTVRGGIVTTYFRRTFTAPAPELYDYLYLRLQRDDGAVIYLNGREIHRSNMPSGEINYAMLASSAVGSLDEQTFEELLLPTSGSGLVAGFNVLAVEIHQSSLDSSDLGFDLDLVSLGSSDRRVYLSSPTANSSIAIPAQVELNAFAFGGVGRSITRVQFFVDDDLVGEDTDKPYQALWPDAPIGSHTAFVIATDDHGAELVSAPIYFSVGFDRVSRQLIAPGSVWKFLDNGSDQGTAWAQPDFNDASWSFGPARLGYGGDDEETTVSYGPSSSSKYITTYFRHAFTLPEGLTVTNLTFRLQRDDGAVVWLNGQEAYRSNMPTGAINRSTLAEATVSNEGESTWFVMEIPVPALPIGVNVVAVEVHQAAGNSSDLGFDLALTGTGFEANVPPPSLQISHTVNNRVLVTWPANAAGWNLYVTDRPDATLWLKVSQQPTQSDGLNMLTFSTTASRRYFRLQKN